MCIIDIIKKKRDKLTLSEQEINYFVKCCVQDTIKDYQISALLMAIYINGLSEEETIALTKAMVKYGDKLELSSVFKNTVDKHSTGGVGDKTTLIIAPVLACLGLKMAKMSGRGLGHTGGTVDKLMSIPGMNLDMPTDKFLEIVEEVGCCIVSQTKNLAPADKKLYMLRDVTATVDNVSLIAASVMSKKLALGAQNILIDVKVGQGAFVKTLEEAIEFSQLLVKIGESYGKNTRALLTNMDVPLGFAVGSSLEVIEACETLKNKGPKDLEEICTELCAQLLNMSQGLDIKQCREKVKAVIKNGQAYEKFCELVDVQAGSALALKDYKTLPIAKYKKLILCKEAGYISRINAEKVGLASLVLGGGRKTKEDVIDYGVGIVFDQSIGDYVQKDETIAKVYYKDKDKLKEAEELLDQAIEYSKTPLEEPLLIYAVVDKNGVKKF